MLTRSKVVWQKALDGLSIRIKKYLFGKLFQSAGQLQFFFPFPYGFRSESPDGSLLCT